MKKTIKLTESDLKQILTFIRKSIKKIFHKNKMFGLLGSTHNVPYHKYAALRKKRQKYHT